MVMVHILDKTNNLRDVSEKVEHCPAEGRPARFVAIDRRLYKKPLHGRFAHTRPLLKTYSFMRMKVGMLAATRGAAFASRLDHVLAWVRYRVGFQIPPSVEHLSGFVPAFRVAEYNGQV